MTDHPTEDWEPFTGEGETPEATEVLRRFLRQVIESRRGDSGMTRLTAIELLDRLPKRDYSDFAALEADLAEVFREHVKQLPNGYGYRELIRWAIAQKWIIRDAGRLGIRLPPGNDHLYNGPLSLSADQLDPYPYPQAAP